MAYVFLLIGLIGWYNWSRETFKGFFGPLILYLVMSAIGFSANQIALIWFVFLALVGLYILTQKS